MTDFQTEGDIPEAPEEAADQGYATQAPTLERAFGAQFSDSAGSGVLTRAFERGRIEGSSPADQAATEGVSALTQSLAQGSPLPVFESMFGIHQAAPPQIPSEMLDADEVNKRYAPVGPDGKAIPITDKPMPERIAQMVGKAKTAEINRESVLQRYSDTTAWPLTFATGTAAFLLDPLNAATAFLPGIGEEAILARLGEGLLARTGARLAAGATAGLAGQVPLSTLKYGLGTEEASDYDLRSAMRDMMMAAAGGAVLHALGGAGRDLILGTPKRPGAPPIEPETPFLTETPEREPLTGAPPILPLNENVAAMHGGISAIVDGRMLDVMPILDARGFQRLSEAETLRGHDEALRAQIAALPPPGDISAADRLNRLDVVNRELADPNIEPDARKSLMQRRDQILVDTTPEALAAAADLPGARLRQTLESRLAQVQARRAEVQAEIEQVRALAAQRVGLIVPESDKSVPPPFVAGIDEFAQRVRDQSDFADFGESKARGPDGKLARVFHGTTQDFAHFSNEHLGEQTGAPSAEEGHFFSSNPEVANGYAIGHNPYTEGGGVMGNIAKAVNKATGGLYQKFNEAILRQFGISGIEHGENVRPVHLNIRNPLEHDFKGAEVRERSFKELIQRAKAEGHDGVVFRNAIDPGFSETRGHEPSDIWVAFNPDQIRSVFHEGAVPSSPWRPATPAEVAARQAAAYKEGYASGMTGPEFQRAYREMFPETPPPPREPLITEAPRGGSTISRGVKKQPAETTGEPRETSPAAKEIADLDQKIAEAEKALVQSAAKRGVTYKGPLSLLHFLASEGGVKDEGGQLSAMDLDKWHLSGGVQVSRNAKGKLTSRMVQRRLPNGKMVGKLVKDTGRTVDYAREKAEEAGYLAPGSAEKDLLNAMAKEAGGEPVYAARDIGTEEEEFDQGAFDDQQEMQRMAAEKADSDWLNEALGMDSEERAEIDRADEGIDESERYEDAAAQAGQCLAEGDIDDEGFLT